MVSKDTSFLGLKRGYALQWGQRGTLLVQVNHTRSGYEWESGGASWALRRIRGLSGRMVLTRNGQSLAAMQYQGRMLNAWSEIVYDGRGYRLSGLPALTPTTVACECSDTLIGNLIPRAGARVVRG